MQLHKTTGENNDTFQPCRKQGKYNTKYKGLKINKALPPE